jgi:hypothetical protein
MAWRYSWIYFVTLSVLPSRQNANVSLVDVAEYVLFIWGHSTNMTLFGATMTCTRYSHDANKV